MDYSKEITALAQKAIQDKVFPGCVIGIVNRAGERQVMAFGNFTYDASSPEVETDTIYDTASLTKSIVTASLALQLIEKGVLKLNEKLITYLPDFNNADREHVVIRHLLTYTAGAYGFVRTVNSVYHLPFKDITAKDLTRLLLTHNFSVRPGTKYEYSNIPMALLGMCIEKVTGRTLDSLAQEYIFNPLHMERSTFFPEKFPLNEIVPTEIDEPVGQEYWRGLVHGIVHDESAYIYKKEGKIVGHAGLFSTVPDILNFLEMLLHKGEIYGKRYFSESTIEKMATNQVAELGDCTGLGFDLNQPRYMGEYATEHTFGKTGFTGTLCICDVEKGIAYTILSNRIYPKRPDDAAVINRFRKDVGTIILKPQP